MEKDLFYKHITYRNQMKDFKKKLLNSSNPQEDIKKVYLFVRKITPDYCINNETSMLYGEILDMLIDCETLIPKGFIIDSNPIFDDEHFAKKTDETWILDAIVYKVRRFLLRDHTFLKKTNINTLTFVNDCAIS